MSKITAEHLARSAYIYIRQSTPDQVRHNRESQWRQYALAERARALGWQQVVIIDEDLGRSAAGQARPGFERLLAAICQGEVGAVVSIEASRLARNGREWHTLLEFCGLVGCLVVDAEGIYDPRIANDRLLLGMKGTISEVELSTLRSRALEALKLKARRGELHTSVAVGYVRSPDDQLEKDPDLRVQQALDLVFRKFRELQSVRQVLLWLREESISLPSVQYGPQGRAIGWRAPSYTMVHKILTNPVYSGAYVFGRTGSALRLQQGRQHISRGIRRGQSEWEVLIKDHHEGYLDWALYEDNQRLIANNANMKGDMVRGAVRSGEALLAGLLRCGHCGRKLQVAYRGDASKTSRYQCRAANVNHGSAVCGVGFGAVRVDAAVSQAVIAALEPLGLQGALRAIEQAGTHELDKRRQVELALSQARSEAARAQRQYDAVEPDYRNVARELERRWNERLAELTRLEQELESVGQSTALSLSEAERQRLLALGQDLGYVWYHSAVTPEMRKRVLRALLKEIVVRVQGQEIQLLLHWHGGDHTGLRVIKSRSGQHRWSTDADTVSLVRELARHLPDDAMVALLNRLGKRTAHGNTWTEARLRALRNNHDIAIYRDGERAERGEVNLEEAAAILGVRSTSVLRLIRAQRLQATQACKGAPWVIARAALDDPKLRAWLASGAKRPVSLSTQQQVLDLQ